MSKVKNQNYFVIHGWMLNELELKGNELLIYALIYGFSQDGETRFRGSLAYIVDFTGSSRTTSINSLASLVDKGFLHKFSDSKNGITFNEYSAVPPVSKRNYPGTDLIPTPGTETAPNNNTLDNKENKKGFPPLEIEVSNYFQENGYTRDAGIKAFRYYEAANWQDSKGNKVKNWKQKMQGVWFKDENKIKKDIPASQFSGNQPAKDNSDLWERAYSKMK